MKGIVFNIHFNKLYINTFKVAKKAIDSVISLDKKNSAQFIYYNNKFEFSKKDTREGNPVYEDILKNLNLKKIPNNDLTIFIRDPKLKLYSGIIEAVKIRRKVNKESVLDYMTSNLFSDNLHTCSYFDAIFNFIDEYKLKIKDIKFVNIDKNPYINPITNEEYFQKGEFYCDNGKIVIESNNHLYDVVDKVFNENELFEWKQLLDLEVKRYKTLTKYE
tara:strand:- start:462 stop:1115 length:654 start_codon:yes stop_codon:yes gene_type:complete